MAAWRSLPALRELDRFAPWLFAIARNRLRDATRAWTRRDTPTADGTLNALVGHTTVGHQGTLGSSDLRDAVRALPHARRHVTRLFYVEGLTIAEIAGRRGSPVGTVKRQLFESRRQLRRSFGIHVAGDTPMGTTQTNRFPADRPNISISKLDEPPFAVDCPELRWRHIVPEVGQTASVATYRPPKWSRDTDVSALRAVRVAEVHGVEGVEIDAGDMTLYARSTAKEVQYLATVMTVDGKAWLRTFLDEGYCGAWGTMPRRIEDTGRYVENADGSLTRADATGPTDAHGVGVYSVRVGEREFECLRVLQLEGDVDDRNAPIDEAFITRAGRTILLRAYCHDGHEGIFVDKNTSITVDGVTRHHWYDILTEQAFA